ncbi:MAG: DUF6797 domain-containing protein [Planctomycetaceae bacterium]
MPSLPLRFVSRAIPAVVVALFAITPLSAGEPAVPAADAKQASPVEKPADKPVDLPRKIVLIAGALDEQHGPGTHEYDATVETIQKAIAGSNVADKVEVVVVKGGWPQDPQMLDDADTILLVSSGADRNEADHPFLVGDRLQVLEKQMDRGCGLMMLHWSVFVPVKYEEQFTRWIGGFFDYERGDDPRGWHSAITFASAKIAPNEKHPISKGVSAFEHRDEYYYRIRFAEDDTRVTPIVTVTLPEVERPQVVAWAVERKDGGRGFAFTGGHFQKSWENDDYRTLMLNALCWTAKVPIPAGGIHQELTFDDQWTPKPHLGKEDLPKEKEEDWVDGRIRESDVGPFYTTSIVAPDFDNLDAAPTAPKDDRKLPTSENMVVKAIAIKVGGTDGVPPAAVLFDKERMTLRCGWTGKFLNFSDRRFGLLEKPTIAGDTSFTTVSNAWATGTDQMPAQVSPASLEWHGWHRHGNNLVLEYAVEDRSLREVNGAEGNDQHVAFSRTIELGPGRTPLTVTLARLPGAKPQASNGFKPAIAAISTGDEAAFATTVGPTDAAVTAHGDRLVLTFPASDEPLRVKILLGAGAPGDLDGFTRVMSASPPPADLDSLTAAGSRQWGEPLVTQGELGKPTKGSPFAVDTITIPYDNPFKALFYCGGFDFAPDGACYLATIHGDVWKVTGIDDDLDEITWQRFATGLYEPLGVKLRDGEIYVLGRDQITKLHDENGDGEADFYECFNDDLTDSGQAHAYAMCLETDAEGNFYFIKSGAPGTPHGGTLCKVAADGSKLEVYATGYRHANGLGIGPDGTITSADNEGNWTPVTRVDIVERGEFLGHVPTAHLDVEPTEPGQPLCWLPRVVDNSAGGQVWVPKGSWGPLADELLHLSFGQCTANLILKEQVDGVWQGGAVKLPLPEFLSGVCRGRFRTTGEDADGHLYVCGTDGWSTSAVRDGNLQRVRYVGGPLLIPTGLNVRKNGIRLSFAEPLDRELASNPERYAVNVWTYQWTKDYGSEDYSTADPTKKGRDKLKVTGATVSEDGRSVFLTIEGLKPVMQLRVQAGLRTAEGAELPVNYYGTVHRLESGK